MLKLIVTVLISAFIFTPLLPAQSVAAANRSCSGSTPVSARPNLKYGDHGSCVKVAQRLLANRGYLASKYTTGNYLSLTVGAVKKFQKNHHISQVGKIGPITWRSLAKKSSGHLPKACTTVKKSLCISKNDRKLRYVVGGKTQMTLAARFGAASTPTRNGVFKVYWKDRHHVSSLFHSPMPYSMFFSGGQAVHYSSDFAARGYNGASHGCVNIKAKRKLALVYNHTPAGTRVVIY